MTTFEQKQGRIGEDIASYYLEKKGYTILQKNYHSRFGEVDLVCQTKEKYWAFVEVKFRRSKFFGSPEDSVNAWKLKKIIKTAQMYLLRNTKKLSIPSFQIDIVAIELDKVKKAYKIRHHCNVGGS